MLDEDGVVELSLAAIVPEALPDAAPLTEPAAELGELVSLETVLLLVLGSLLATRAESVLTAELSLEVEAVVSLEVEAVLLWSLLAIVESVEVRPVGERLSSEEVAPALMEPESDVAELLEELGVWLASVSELAEESELVLAVVPLDDEVSAESVVPAVLVERSVSEVELIEPLAEPLALPEAVPATPNEPLEDGVALVEPLVLGLEDELLLMLLFVVFVVLFAIDVF